MEAIKHIETPINFYYTTGRHISGYGNLVVLRTCVCSILHPWQPQV